MAQDGYPHLPQEALKRDIIQLTPAKVAESSYTSDALATDTEYLLTMDTDATIIRVIAGDYGIYMKWATGVAASSDNFDEYIPANTVMDFVIPSGKTTASFLADGATTKIRIIEK